MAINRTTGIETRASVQSYDSDFVNQTAPPSVSEVDAFYRQAGVDLAVQACRKALKEWGGEYSDITHTIAVTCTNQGNPGYDLLVHKKLGLEPTVDRMLLHGVGCAGGLAIMRAAAQIASGAASRHRPARILAFACELCTPIVRSALAEAESCPDPKNVSIGAALFSDAAAAFVLCNEYGLGEKTKPLFELIEWGNATIPETIQYMGFLSHIYGAYLKSPAGTRLMDDFKVSKLF